MSWLREAHENGEAARDLVAIAGGAAGTLLGGDGLDEELAALGWIERDFGAMERGVHERWNSLRIRVSGGPYPMPQTAKPPPRFVRREG